MSFNRAGKAFQFATGGFITHNEARSLSGLQHEAGAPVPTIMPRLPRQYRDASVECEGCGAVVHPHEYACTYCTRVPEGKTVEVEIPFDDLIEVTTLCDEVRRYIVEPGRRVLHPPRKP